MNQKDKTEKMKQMLIDSNRGLQETAQKLLMAKRELEERNKELEEAKEKERQQKEHLQHELNALKHLAGSGIKKEVGHSPKKKLTKGIAEDLSLRYIHLLESYLKTKDLGEDEPLFEELCQKLIEYGITPKGIIDIHLKTVPQIKTIGDLETRRITFESRIVLLKVMTTYASLLHEKLSA